jgi:hypothetical protein
MQYGRTYGAFTRSSQYGWTYGDTISTHHITVIACTTHNNNNHITPSSVQLPAAIRPDVLREHHTLRSSSTFPPLLYVKSVHNHLDCCIEGTMDPTGHANRLTGATPAGQIQQHHFAAPHANQDPEGSNGREHDRGLGEEHRGDDPAPEQQDNPDLGGEQREQDTAAQGAQQRNDAPPPAPSRVAVQQ